MNESQSYISISFSFSETYSTSKKRLSNSVARDTRQTENINVFFFSALLTRPRQSTYFKYWVYTVRYAQIQCKKKQAINTRQLTDKDDDVNDNVNDNADDAATTW